MKIQPVFKSDWLRRERSYRAYILGMRWALCWGAGFAFVALLAAPRLISGTAVKVLVVLCMAGGAASVVMGMIGWLRVPDKNRAANQRGFLVMVARDLFLGIPRRQ